MKTGKFCTKMKISDVCNKISPVLQALFRWADIRQILKLTASRIMN